MSLTRWILQQRLQWTKAEDLVQHLLRQPVAFDGRERNILLPDQLLNGRHQLLLRGGVLVHQRDLLQIQPLDQAKVNRGLDLLLHFEGNRLRGSHDRGNHRGFPAVPVPPLIVELVMRNPLVFQMHTYFHSANFFFAGS